MQLENNYSKYLDYVPWILCILFLALNLIVFIKYPFLSVDEGYTKGMINFQFFDMLNCTMADVHPPLYYAVVMFFMTIFKTLHINYDVTHLMKIPSLIGYFVILLISWFKIRKDYGLLTAGIFSLTILVMSDFFVHYLTARMYSLALIFMIASFIYVKSIYENNDLKSWILLAIFSVLGAYTHYFAALSSVAIYIILLIWILMYGSKNFELGSKLKNFFISVVIGAALYIPWLPTLFAQLSVVHDNYWIPQITLKTMTQFLSYYYTSMDKLPLQLFAILVLVVVTVKFAMNFYKSRETADFYLLTGVLVFLGTLFVGAMVSLFFKPILYDRYLLPSVGLVWFSFSIAISNIKSKKIILVILILIAVLGAGNVYHQVHDIQTDYKNTVYEEGVLKSINNNDTIILFDTDNHYIRTYYALDKVHDKYASFKQGNKTRTLDYDKFDANYTTFVLPKDVKNFTDKNVYVMVFYKNKLNGTHYEHIGTAQHAKIYKVT